MVDSQVRREAWQVRRELMIKLTPVWVRCVMAVLAASVGLWLIWIGIPRVTVPAATEADLRGVPAEVKWQARDSRHNLQNDARTTLLQGLGGFAVLLGAFYTYRQLHVTREGQVTDRFSRAIDHLGHESLDVRLGGIYALERIADDSPQDRTIVAQVLCAFVRGHAPWPPSRPDQPGKETSLKSVPLLQVWAADVQAAITVLGRRKHPIPPWTASEKWRPSHWLNLISTDLRRATLPGAQLNRAILSGAQLHRAILMGSRLQMSSLIGAELERANLSQAELQHANLSGAGLQNADLRNAQTSGSDASRRPTPRG